MRHKGFTLIEVLIALSIFAIMATITSLTLSSIFSTRQTVQNHANSLADLQVTYHLLQQDLTHLVAKAMYDQNNRPHGSFEGELKRFIFTRDQFFPAKANATSGQLQRLAYVIKDGQLLRQTLSNNYDVLESTPLLKHIESFELQYLGDKNYWHDKWQDWQRNTIPRAVRIHVEIQQLGKTSFLFSIPHDEVIKIEQAS